VIPVSSLARVSVASTAPIPAPTPVRVLRARAVADANAAFWSAASASVVSVALPTVQPSQHLVTRYAALASFKDHFSKTLWRTDFASAAPGASFALRPGPRCVSAPPPASDVAFWTGFSACLATGDSVELAPSYLDCAASFTTTPDASLLDNMVPLRRPIPISGFGDGAMMATHTGELKGFGVLPYRLTAVAFYAPRSTATLLSLGYMNGLSGGFNFHSDSGGLLHMTDSGAGVLVELCAYPRAGNHVWRIEVDPQSLEARRLVAALKAGPVAHYAHYVSAIAPRLDVCVFPTRYLWCASSTGHGAGSGCAGSAAAPV
jgi:hypothetical protein